MRRPDKRTLIHWAGIITVLAAVALVLWRVQVQADRVDALAAALGDEQSAVEAGGGEPVAPDPEDLLDDPDYTGPAGPTGPPGPGPSDAQVYAAVTAYFAANPVTAEGPSAAEIAAAVADYLQDYPPGPTPEQVAVAVAEYLTANPPAPGVDGKDGAPGATGPPGPQGEPGPGPTAEQIAAEVQAYMEAHPLPECPDGYSYSAQTLMSLSGPPVDAVVCTA